MYKIAIMALLCVAVTACANRQQATGTAVGAGTGLLVAGPIGAVVGAGVGAVVAAPGGVVDNAHRLTGVLGQRPALLFAELRHAESIAPAGSGKGGAPDPSLPARHRATIRPCPRTAASRWSGRRT